MTSRICPHPAGCRHGPGARRGRSRLHYQRTPCPARACVRFPGGHGQRGKSDGWGLPIEAKLRAPQRCNNVQSCKPPSRPPPALLGDHPHARRSSVLQKSRRVRWTGRTPCCAGPGAARGAEAGRDGGPGPGAIPSHDGAAEQARQRGAPGQLQDGQGGPRRLDAETGPRPGRHRPTRARARARTATPAPCTWPVAF